MKPKFRHIRSLAIASSALVSISYAHAATRYWDVNGTATGFSTVVGTWDGTNAFWNTLPIGTGGVPVAATTSADDLNIVAATTNTGTITLSGARAASSISFASGVGAITMSGGTSLTIGGTGALSGIFKSSSSAQTISTSLILGAASEFRNNAAGNLSVKGGINLNGFALTVGGVGNTDLGDATANFITGAGGIIKNGTGNLILSASGTAPVHNFSGGITVNGGRVAFQNSTNVTAVGNITLNGGYLGGRSGSSPTFAGGLGTGTTAIRITGGVSGFSGEGATSSTFLIGTALSVLKWGASGENGATGFFNPTVLILGGLDGMNANAKGSLNNAIDLNGTTRTITSLHTNGDGATNTGFTLSGAISNSTGTAGLIKTGAGAIILGAANTYNGSTSIQGGSLILSAAAATINSTTALNLSGGGTLRLVNTANTQRFADAAAITSNGGGIDYINTASASVSYTETIGTLDLASGQTNLVLTTDQTLAGNQTLTINTGGITRTGAANSSAITFSAGGTGLNATKNIILVTGATPSGAGNIIGPWATVGTTANVQTTYAAYDASSFVVAAALTAATLDTDLASSTANYEINTGSLFTLAGTRTVNAVSFKGSASTLDLATFRLETNGLLFSGGTTNTKTITAGVGGALTTPNGGGNLYITAGQVMTATNEHKINAPITNADGGGTVNLVKSGAGILILNGANTFTGTIAINAGTLRIGTSGTANGANLNSGTYAGNIFIGAGANLDFQTNVDQTLSGIISGDGNLLKRGIGTLTLGNLNTYTGKTTLGAVANNPSPTLVVSSFNSVVGGTASSSLGAPTTVANGTIELGSGNSSPNPTLRYTGAAALGETTDRVINFTFNSTATRTLDASNGSGLLKFTSAFTSNGTATGHITLAGTGAGEITQGLPFAFTNLIKTGTGSWTLGGASGGTGTVTIGTSTVSGGTLNITNGRALGTGAVSITTNVGNSSFGHLALNSATGITVANNFTTSGEGTESAGIIRNVTGNNQISGTITLTSGGGNTRISADGGTLLLSGAIALTTSSRSLVLSGSATGTVSGAITNTGGVLALNKEGVGTWILTGSNGYTGTTSVNVGTLLVNNTTGSGTGTNTVSVALGATLGGTGTIAGAVNVTGVLSPGASIETLGTGALSFANGSTLAHELDSSVATSSGSDLLKVTGNLNLVGSVGLTLADLALTDVAFNVGDTFSLINYTGSLTGGGLFAFGGNDLAEAEEFTFGLNSWRINYGDTSGGLNFSGEYAGGLDSFVNLTVVPEPSSVALLGTLGAMLLLRRRR